MNIKNLFKKVYSHFFQTMPGEMTIKSFWSSYRLVANRYLNGHYDLTMLRPENTKTTMGGKTSLSIGIMVLMQLQK